MRRTLISFVVVSTPQHIVRVRLCCDWQRSGEAKNSPLRLISTTTF